MPQNKKIVQEELVRVDREIIRYIKLSDYFNISMDALVGKDLKNKDNAADELDMLFNKTKPYLNDSDKTILKTSYKRKENK